MSQTLYFKIGVKILKFMWATLDMTISLSISSTHWNVQNATKIQCFLQSNRLRNGLNVLELFKVYLILKIRLI